VRATALILAVFCPFIVTAAPACPAGVAVAHFRAEIRRAGADLAIPVERVNTLRKGDTVTFIPSDGPAGADLAKARVALVVLTAAGEMIVLETKKANARVFWTIPDDASAVALAYGPRGFDEDRVKGLASKDPEVIAQLAEYSEKTTQTELLVASLAAGTVDDRGFDGALRGLASAQGASALNRTAPADQQTLAMLRGLNPAIGAYDPLAPDQRQRWQQSTTLASSVAGMFFGSYVGLAGGGASMFLNLRGMLFPKTELRSALLRDTALCAAKRDAPRARLGFLWARRLPGGSAPSLKLTKVAHVAAGLPATIPVDATGDELTTAGRAFRWKLTSADGAIARTAVSTPASENALRFIAPAKPGRYTLAADWDWTPLSVEGAIEVHALPQLSAVKLSKTLIAGTGRVRARLEGAPLYFLQSVTLRKPNDALAKPVAIPFAATDTGAEIEIDTASLDAAPYVLELRQQGGTSANIPVFIEAPAPVISGLPLQVHRGASDTVTLTGTGLDRIQNITARSAVVKWDRARRTAQFTLKPDAPDSLDLDLTLEGRPTPFKLANAVAVNAAKPKIVAVHRAAQPAGTVERRENEIDSAQPASFSLRLDRPATTSIALRCGAELSVFESRQIAPDTIYVTIPASHLDGCALEASAGGSAHASVGLMTSLPAIENFTLSNDPAGDAKFKGALRGQRLEKIARTGWTADHSEEATDLPTPIESVQQLPVVMPWPAPAPHAPLQVWLRGEQNPRKTTARF
jgi:hypothetical protein